MQKAWYAEVIVPLVYASLEASLLEYQHAADSSEGVEQMEELDEIGESGDIDEIEDLKEADA